MDAGCNSLGICNVPDALQESGRVQLIFNGSDSTTEVQTLHNISTKVTKHFFYVVVAHDYRLRLLSMFQVFELDEELSAPIYARGAHSTRRSCDQTAAPEMKNHLS